MKTSSAQTLVIGCGYIGLPLALEWQKQGHEVDVWVHSQASADALAEYAFRQVVIGSVADPLTWDKVTQSYDVMVHCASSGRGGEAAYEEVFLRGVRLMNEREPSARRIFVSSTSVYGQNDGTIVTEESPAEPSTATGRILREAEKAAIDSNAIVVRSSGIYGPGRSVLLERLRRGGAVIEGDGLRWINQIHQHDLVSALRHLITAGETGQIYNATDDTPVTYRDYYAWCSNFLDKPMPPYGPVNMERKRGFTNKRVSNDKLHATGWQPGYPSFSEGLADDAHSPK